MSILDELKPGQTVAAITVLQPWATIIAAGHKHLETRTWRTDYKGALAIHAGKRYDDEYRSLAPYYPFQEALIDAQDRGLWNGELPLGAVVAIARLVGCFTMPGNGTGRGRYDFNLSTARGGPMKLPPDQPERDFGYFAPGRVAWRLVDVVAIRPIAARGHQNLWQWEIPAGGLEPIARITARMQIDREGPRYTECLCGAPASGSCDVCGRGYCALHTHEDPGGVICYGCYSRGRLRRKACAMCGCQPLLPEPRNLARQSACPLHDDCPCHTRPGLDNPHGRCSACRGSGVSRGVACIFCGGTGRYTKPLSIGGIQSGQEGGEA